MARGGRPHHPVARLRRHSGLLSALGLALADVVHEAQEPCSLPYVPETFMQLDQRLSRLEEQCVDALRAQGFPRWGPGGWAGLGQGLAASQVPSRLVQHLTSPMVPGPLRAVLREEWTLRLEEVGRASSRGARVRVPPVHPAGPRSAPRASCTCATRAQTAP